MKSRLDACGRERFGPADGPSRHCGRNGQVESAYYREEPKHIRLRDANTTGDVLDGCAMQPQLRELR